MSLSDGLAVKTDRIPFPSTKMLFENFTFAPKRSSSTKANSL